jgi:uncharacterized membrane protein
MKLGKYRRIRAAMIVAIAMLTAFGVIQNSIFIALAGVTCGIIALYLLRRGLTAIVHDERTILVRSKAASMTLAVITVGMAVIGLSLIFLSGQGIGNYEQAGYLLAFQANIVLATNAVMSYYYQHKLGG